MRRLVGTLTVLTLFLSTFLIGTASPAQAATIDKDSGSPKHIFYIMMENHSTNEIFGNTADAPYINWLASKYGIAENYYGVTHPSSPNYLAAISGSFQGIWDDCPAGPTVTCAPEEFGPDSGYTNGQELLTPQEIASATSTPHWFSSKNIVDQLEAHDLSWKAYMQSMPSTGFTGSASPIINGQPVQLYVQKHNPFEYFTDIRNNAARMQKIVPFTQLGLDLAKNTVPNFVWISPDTCNDMHGISPTSAQEIGNPACAYPSSGLDHSIIQLGDNFVQSTVSTIMASRVWKQSRSSIVIAWDENDYSGYTGCCHSPTGVNGVTLGGANAPFMVINSNDVDHIVDTTPYNHYTLLATIEKLWHLGCLNQSCGFSDKQLMTKFFV
ncbi:MAG TPA: hypothetical protein DHW02_18795 [Ktedonobacter sp.]|nr:hypothetical protein [Ktedonobacter sp.]